MHHSLNQSIHHRPSSLVEYSTLDLYIAITRSRTLLPSITMTMILFVAVLLAVVVVDVADAFNIIGRHNNQLRPAAPHRIRHQHHHHSSSGSISSGPALSALVSAEEDVVLESLSSYGFETSKVITIISKQKVGSDEDDSGGYYYRFQHLSTSTKTNMIFGLFLPSSYNESSNDENENKNKIPILFWLSGLTCDDTNFAMKAGSSIAFQEASKQNIAILMPDTSPRGDDVPDDPSYDIGIGAGFYIDATKEPYKTNYQMRSYITKELPALLLQEFHGLATTTTSTTTGDSDNDTNTSPITRLLKSISGHSMGGHGALSIGLSPDSVVDQEEVVQNEGQVQVQEWISLSAISPIVNPVKVPWGIKAFTTYLGNNNVEEWKKYDATNILLDNTTSGGKVPIYDEILIDQGTEDEFLETQLLPQHLLVAAASANSNINISLNMRDGYDHSYYFISAFIKNHIQFHSKRLYNAMTDVNANANDANNDDDDDVDETTETESETTKGKQEQQKDSHDNDNDDELTTSSSTSTIGKPIKCKAMVARGPKQPLTEEIIIVDPPKAGEVRVKVIANALCHTDIYTLDGYDPEGLFPCILGHEAGCIVESIGDGVTSVAIGDHVIPCYTPQCNEIDCIFCMSSKTNLCPKIRSTQGKGVMPDGTSRFTDTINGTGTGSKGNSIYHFMGCSTMSEYTVLAEISCAKINKDIPLEKACLFGCGVSTGLGAVWNTCNVERDSSVSVHGVGAVGLAVIQASKIAGATKIIAIDINPEKFKLAKELGATHCINPNDCKDGDIRPVIVGELTDWGVDYSFDCTGNTEVMRTALEVAHRGWGESCVIGVAAAGHEISTRPFQLVTGRVWKGTAFGGFKSRRDVPKLVQANLDGNLPIDHYITHRFDGVGMTNAAISALHTDSCCLRAVVRYGPQ